MSIEAIECDVLVIGGGLAGSYAAIKAKESGADKVTLVSKGKLGKDGVSTFAAGVWAGGYSPEDDRETEFKKRALSESYGGGLYDEEWLDVFMDESYERLLELDRWGVEWEKTPDGKYDRKECRWKLLMCMFHGPQLMEAVARKVIASGVRVIGHTMITDLLTENGKQEGRVTGAVGFDVRTGEFRVFNARAIVMAAGGCGFKERVACYKFQTGEAAVMAYRAGAELGKFEVTETHSMTATGFSTQGKNMFVGLGGKFVNARGERFMFDYDTELEEHAGQSYISGAMAMEVRAGRGPIYLDMTHFTTEDVKKLRAVLPVPTRILERAGVMVGDRIVKKIEWAPSLIGSVSLGGGIIANTKCESSLVGLYACGDAMARGPQLPSMIPGAAVTGARAGTSAARYAKGAPDTRIDDKQVARLKKSACAAMERKDGFDPYHVIIGIQEVLTPYEVSLILREDRLERAIKDIERIRDEEVPLLCACDPHNLVIANEAVSMVLVAEMMLRSWLFRKESRIGCLREDYPYVDNENWLKWTLLKQEGGKMKLWAKDIPPGRYKPDKARYLHPIFEAARKRGVAWG
ncbi:MAG: FAD-binding protein [Dehalococcoidia bacterium]|nr:FAD-binding protein [Dehalococcoidia bacterium]